MASISSLGIGSGLDLNGLLGQLQEAEQEKLKPIQQQQAAQESQISAYGQLQGALSQFQSSTSKLNSQELFQSVTSDVQGGSVEAAATPDAPPGRYEVNVESLATASSVATGGVAQDQVLNEDGDVEIDITFGDKPAKQVEIAQGSTLGDVRDAINTSDAGVTASLVFDGADYRLALSSQETGSDASIDTVDFGDLGLNIETRTGGDNAELDVNGIQISHQSNRLEEAIEGVTLNLVDTGSSTVTVERDTGAVRDTVSDFVDGYNELKATTGELTSFDPETGEAGELLGDSTMRMAESRLRSVLSGGVESGDFQMLHDVGISLRVDGTLEIDESRLDDAIANESQAVMDFFAGDGDSMGLAGKLDSALDQMLGSQGLMDNAVSGAENRLQSLHVRHEQMEKSIEQTIERYRVQFGQLDGMIAEMNQTSEYLTQQLSTLDAQMQGAQQP